MTLTVIAWQALDAGNYDEVLVYTRKCLQLYKKFADEMQSRLDSYAPKEKVWTTLVTPDDIKKWKFASQDCCCPDAKPEFMGEFTFITAFKDIDYTLYDFRRVSIIFLVTEQRIQVVETFEAEDELSSEQQKQGWQNVIDNFKKYVEAIDN